MSNFLFPISGDVSGESARVFLIPPSTPGTDYTQEMRLDLLPVWGPWQCGKTVTGVSEIPQPKNPARMVFSIGNIVPINVVTEAPLTVWSGQDLGMLASTQIQAMLYDEIGKYQAALNEGGINQIYGPPTYNGQVITVQITKADILSVRAIGPNFTGKTDGSGYWFVNGYEFDCVLYGQATPNPEEVAAPAPGICTMYNDTWSMDAGNSYLQGAVDPLDASKFYLTAAGGARYGATGRIVKPKDPSFFVPGNQYAMYLSVSDEISPDSYPFEFVLGGTFGDGSEIVSLDLNTLTTTPTPYAITCGSTLSRFQARATAGRSPGSGPVNINVYFGDSGCLI